MKKTFSVLVIVTIMLSVFFCTPVYADDIVTANASFSQTFASGNCRVLVIATDLYGFTDSVVSDGSGYIYGQHEVLLTVRFINYSSTSQYFGYVFPYITVGMVNASSQIQPALFERVLDIENVTDEAYISFNNTDRFFEINPSVNFQFGSSVCVPANSAVTAIAKVKFRCSLSGLTYPNELLYAKLTGVGIYNSTFTANATDYTPIGSHDDLLISLEATRQTLINQGYGLPTIEKTLEDIRDILEANNTTNDNISNDSIDLKTQSDSVHSQEASYYAQNSQAIAATGLSNYQFDSNASSGIGGVRGDFVDVWNALSGWNSIYVFSLTLGLALTILRHSPSAISSAIRRRRDNTNG